MMQLHSLFQNVFQKIPQITQVLIALPVRQYPGQALSSVPHITGAENKPSIEHNLWVRG